MVDVIVTEEDVNVTLTEDVIDVSITGGEGVSSHNLLANLDWEAAEHTGTADKLAGFDGSGDPTYYDAPGAIDHATTTNREWSVAGHSIDTTVDMDNNDITNIKELILKNGGSMGWNANEYTIDIDTTLGPVLQVGQEQYVLFYNDTGSSISNGKVLHPVGGAMSGGTVVPTVELADASDFEKCQGTLFITTHTVANNSLGFGTRFGKVRGLDTTVYGAGAQLWLSCTNPGELTATKSVFPCYSLSMGGTLNSDATDGEIFVSLTSSVEDTFHEAWDGAIRESFDFRTSSAGTVITGTLTNPNTEHDNLTLFFSEGMHTFELPASGSITLTGGTATVPQMNYVYIPMSTKVLTVSTTSFPVDEHCKVAKVLLQDAASTQTYGALRNQNINDHIKTDDDNGHILHMAERIRELNAQWDNGIEGSLTGTPTNLYFANTSGQVWQMHKQTFVASDMATGGDIHVVNDPTTPYKAVTNLNDYDEYSTGSSNNNDWSNIVVWGVCNKTGEASHVMVNLPSDGYNTESNAIADRNNYTNYTIPKAFQGVGFLIGRFTIRRSAAVFTYNSGSGYLDLRGYFPNNTAGGGAGSSGITTFLGLTDTPSAYTGQAGKVATVNAGETALEFSDVAGGLPKGYINGGVVSNDSVTPDSLIDITAVEARSADNTTDISISAYSLDITANADWASGTAPSLTSTTIHTWADYNSGTERLIFDDVTGSNLTDANKARRVGSFITDSSGDIVPFTTEGNGDYLKVFYDDSITDVSNTTSASFNFSVPENADEVQGTFETNSTGSTMRYVSFQSIQQLISGRTANERQQFNAKNEDVKVVTANGTVRTCSYTDRRTA